MKRYICKKCGGEISAIQKLVFPPIKELVCQKCRRCIISEREKFEVEEI